MAESELEKLFDAALENVHERQLADEIRAVQSGNDSFKLTADILLEKENETEEDQNLLMLKISGMRIPEKIKCALYGNKIARRILIRDTSRQIPPFVLKNPRLTEGEVVEFVKNTQLDELVLRSIANRASWMKSYQMKLAAVSNPKMPIDISLRYIKFIQERDLRRLSKSKNISQIVAAQCRKLIDKRQKAKQ